jgi:integrase
LNLLLNKYENETFNIYRRLLSDEIRPNNELLREELRKMLLLPKEERTNKYLSQYDFLELFNEFIKDSEKGIRVQKNGKEISRQSIEQYYYIAKYLKDFSKKKYFKLVVYNVANKSEQQLSSIKKYYADFYHYYTEYLYRDRKYFDNTVGSNIKVVRAFFNYLDEVRGVNVGSYHRSFFVRKEEIPVLVIEPEQLNYLIKDKTLEETLSPKEQRAKDYFVVGSTFALRLSDLKRVTWDNIVFENGANYLLVVSKKTGSTTKVLIPDYCIEIFERYSKEHKTLLPPTNSNELNQLLRQVGKKCNWNKPIIKTRERRGKVVVIYKDEKNETNFELSDLITMHCARRTAITTLLRLGVPEHVVKTISGHSPNSTSFHKYVEVAESYKNQQFSNAIDKLLQIGSC